MTDREEFGEFIGNTLEEECTDAESWYKSALSFNEAAMVLYEYQEEISGGSGVCLFNAALSLELMAKGILTAQGETIPASHDLGELCGKAGIELDEDQQATLGLLTEIFSWVRQRPAMPLRREQFPSIENYTRVWKACLRRYAGLGETGR